MARQLESDLYQKLVQSEFAFLPKGESTLIDIYIGVKKKFRKFCDDTYLCKDNCKNGNNKPEWQHIVRSALHRLQNSTDVLKHSKVRGTWIIDPEKFGVKPKDEKKVKETKPKVASPKIKTVEDTKKPELPKGKNVTEQKPKVMETKKPKETPKVKEVKKDVPKIKTVGPLSEKKPEIKSKKETKPTTNKPKTNATTNKQKTQPKNKKLEKHPA